MSWLYLPAVVAEYSADGCSDGKPCAMSNGIDIALTCSKPASETDISMMPRFGTMLSASTGIPGLDAWILSLLASRANHLAVPENDLEKTTRVMDGPPRLGSFARYDPESSGWKTYPIYSQPEKNLHKPIISTLERITLTMSKLTPQEQGRLNKRQGAVGQSVAALALRRLGVLMTEQIATPVILRPAHEKGAFYVTYGEKVSGDHRGILPGGRSVLAETKSMHGDRLRYSDLLPHQPIGLTKHAQDGGLSLLIWASDYGTFTMRWPVDGFVKGTSIKVDQAKALDLESLPNFSYGEQ